MKNISFQLCILMKTVDRSVACDVPFRLNFEKRRQFIFKKSSSKRLYSFLVLVFASFKRKIQESFDFLYIMEYSLNHGKGWLPRAYRRTESYAHVSAKLQTLLFSFKKALGEFLHGLGSVPDGGTKPRCVWLKNSP